MELNKSNIIISILKSNNENNFFAKKENLFITILLLDKFQCIDDIQVREIFGTTYKMRRCLETAQERILINKNFRKKYLSFEQKLNDII